MNEQATLGSFSYKIGRTLDTSEKQHDIYNRKNAQSCFQSF